MRTTKALLTLVTLFAASSSLAGKNYRHHDYIYAPVVEVQPVFEQGDHERYQRCMYENRHGRNSHRDEGKGAVIGGILGGLIGNRFGKGNGRKASTAAGVIIGATIGAESSKHNKHRNHMRQRDCQRYASSERVIGFDVSYDYNGRIYQTFMRNHPGERVKLEVNMQVAEY